MPPTCDYDSLAFFFCSQYAFFSTYDSPQDLQEFIQEDKSLMSKLKR